MERKVGWKLEKKRRACYRDRFRRYICKSCAVSERIGGNGPDGGIWRREGMGIGNRNDPDAHFWVLRKISRKRDRIKKYVRPIFCQSGEMQGGNCGCYTLRMIFCRICPGRKDDGIFDRTGRAGRMAPDFGR